MNEQAFEKGFVKAAQEFGLTATEAQDLFKQAAEPSTWDSVKSKSHEAVEGVKSTAHDSMAGLKDLFHSVTRKSTPAGVDSSGSDAYHGGLARIFDPNYRESLHNTKAKEMALAFGQEEQNVRSQKDRLNLSLDAEHGLVGAGIGGVGGAGLGALIAGKDKRKKGAMIGGGLGALLGAGVGAAGFHGMNEKYTNPLMQQLAALHHAKSSLLHGQAQ